MKRRAVELLGDFYNRGIESFLALAESEAELCDLIEYLICHREELKESALRDLESETERLVDHLGELQRAELLAELECFKDALSLHRRMPR